MRIIELQRRTAWSAEFLAHAAVIRAALGALVVEVHHIGSTAIPGIAAKPIIDILLEVSSLEQLDRSAHLLENLGYEALGEFGLAGRRYFRKGGEQRTHHLHAYESGHPDIHRHIAFRDYLKANRVAATQYESVKLAAAKEFRDSPDAYAQSKSAIITKLEQEALLWAAKFADDETGHELA